LIICTGRDQICEQETRDWLTKHQLDDIHELHMRKEKDHRKDFIIKEEMWRDISTRWNIIAMFDDRNQVVNHARKLGFKVLQVAEGNF